MGKVARVAKALNRYCGSAGSPSRPVEGRNHEPFRYLGEAGVEKVTRLTTQTCQFELEAI